MKITITEQIKDVKMVYEIVGNKEEVISAVFDLGFKDRWEDGDYGKVAEHAVLASEEVCKGVLDTFKPDELPEYLEGVDLSVIPDDWEEVWVAQDEDGDIIAFEEFPVVSDVGNWWKRNNSCVDVRYNGPGKIENWKSSPHRLR